MKKISLLGSTGSIGTQSLDVCEMHGYDVKCLTANSKVDIMEEQIRKFKPDMVCMMSETAAKELKAKMKEQQIDEPLSITSYSLATVLRLAEQGLGIAVVPQLTALKEIVDGRLEILNTPIQLKSFHFTAIYLQGNNGALKEKLTELAITVSEKSMKNLNETLKKNTALKK